MSYRLPRKLKKKYKKESVRGLVNVIADNLEKELMNQFVAEWNEEKDMIEIDNFMHWEWKQQSIHTFHSGIGHAIHYKDQKMLDMVKDALGNPGELLNLKIEQITDYQVLEKEGKLSIQFELH